MAYYYSKHDDTLRIMGGEKGTEMFVWKFNGIPPTYLEGADTIAPSHLK